MNRQFKYLTLFITLNITFQLISDAAAGKIILVFGYGVSVASVFFPVTYIISDVLTEVYGYAEARRVLWYTLLASVVAGLTYLVVVAIPAAPFFENAEAYSVVFGIIPRVLVGGWLAVFAGDISNNFVLAKLKIRTRGKLLWLRTIGSTVIGQGINTLVFYGVALSGVLPPAQLLQGILAAWLMKTVIEAVMTPVTYKVIGFLKKAEGVDHYDRDTNFNPFRVID